MRVCHPLIFRSTVIESVISRLHRLVESRQKQLRIVGLSATLPNYQDVAEFLHVPERGLFYFGPEYRPVPLQQTFVGVMGNVKNRKLIEDKMNDVCYEQVKDALARVSGKRMNWISNSCLTFDSSISIHQLHTGLPSHGVCPFQKGNQ